MCQTISKRRRAAYWRARTAVDGRLRALRRDRRRSQRRKNKGW